MSAEQMRHMALPTLVGAPAYARPTVLITRVERPFSPDDLPLQAVMTDEERALLYGGPVLVQPGSTDDAATPTGGRAFSLRGLTSRFRAPRD